MDCGLPGQKPEKTMINQSAEMLHDMEEYTTRRWWHTLQVKRALILHCLEKCLGMPAQAAEFAVNIHSCHSCLWLQPGLFFKYPCFVSGAGAEDFGHAFKVFKS